MAKILLGDDDPITRRLVEAYLRGAGHHVVCASDGMRAVSILDDNRSVSLLISDVVMPELDGVGLLRAVRASECLRDLPAILMSATVKLSEIIGYLEMGATRFLVKPVDRDRLITEVAACLDGSAKIPLAGSGAVPEAPSSRGTPNSRIDGPKTYRLKGAP